MAFTASHNSRNGMGSRSSTAIGVLLMTDETNRIEAETNQMRLEDVIKIPLDVALSAGIAEYGDFTNAYIDRIESFIDMAAVRKMGLKVIVDTMYG